MGMRRGFIRRGNIDRTMTGRENERMGNEGVPRTFVDLDQSGYESTRRVAGSDPLIAPLRFRSRRSVSPFASSHFLNVCRISFHRVESVPSVNLAIERVWFCRFQHVDQCATCKYSII